MSNKEGIIPEITDDCDENLTVDVNLVPLDSPSFAQGFKEYKEQLREAWEVPASDWPKGRTVKINMEVALVPINISTEFGQE